MNRITYNKKRINHVHINNKHKIKYKKEIEKKNMRRE